MPSTVPARPAPRPFTRAPGDSRLGGVCGGLADRWDVDPILLRIGALVLVLSGGVGVVLYATAWLLWPTADGRPSPLEATVPGAARLPHWVWWAGASGLVVVVMVLLAPVLPLGPLPALLLTGIVLVGRRHRRRTTAPVSASPPATYPPFEITHPARVPAPTRVLPAPVAPPPARPPRRGLVLGIVTFLALTAALGGLALAQVAGESVPLPVWGGVTLIVLGVSSVIGAFSGPHRTSQVLTFFVAVPVALALCLPAAGHALADPDRLTPSAAELSAGIDDPVRVAVIDLSDLSLPAGGEGHIDVKAGRIVVVAPRRASSEISLSTSAAVLQAGDSPAFGAQHAVVRTGSGPNPYRLRIHVDLGALEVRR